MRKKCPNCKRAKRFNKNAARHDGLDSWCTTCTSAYHRAYYKKNLEKQRERKRVFVKNHPTYSRSYALRTKYGLTEDQFKAILKFQKGRCGLCRTKRPGGRYGVWAVDHDHETNTVRGLLCFNCNKHLGFYERIAEEIEKYLKNPPAQSVLRSA